MIVDIIYKPNTNPTSDEKRNKNAQLTYVESIKNKFDNLVFTDTDNID